MYYKSKNEMVFYKLSKPKMVEVTVYDFRTSIEVVDSSLKSSLVNDENSTPCTEAEFNKAYKKALKRLII